MGVTKKCWKEGGMSGEGGGESSPEAADEADEE